MGHLCSCHRQAKFDKGQFRSSGSTKWKGDTSLIHKLRLRCSYLSGTSVHSGRSLPPPADRPRSSEASHAAAATGREHPASSPSSPSPTRAATAPPKPPRMRSMLLNGRSSEDRKRVEWASSELDLGSVSSTGADDVILSGSLRTMMVDGIRSGSSVSRRHTGGAPGSRAMSSLLSHMTELLASSGVRPELLVDFLRRHDVVAAETAAAVRRCVARRAACELIAEVVSSRGEVQALCDGLRATECADIADCLSAVDALLQLTDLSHLSVIDDCSTWRVKSRDDNDDYHTNTPESQPEDSLLNSSVDVDVLYVDVLTGSDVTLDSDADATSTARSNRLKHRSLFIDPETMSLPPQLLASFACSGRPGGLPVASITFHRVRLPSRLADRLADILDRFRSFRVLTFVKCQGVNACLARFRQNLVNRKCAGELKLSRLHIRLSHIDDVKVVTELAAVTSRSFHALSLTGCSIMSTGCESVVRGVVTGSRCLYELDLGFNDISDVTSLADALSANCSLRRLRLRGNAIQSDSARPLFHALRRNYRLELLDVSANPIGERRADELWSVLAEALLSNRTLRQLNLERCSLNVDACAALGRVLAANTTLRTLDVSMNPAIGDLGVVLLADGLRRNRRCGVRSLALNMCAVGDTGFRSLLVAISYGGASLRHIKLCYNRIGSKDERRCRRRRRLRSGDGSRRASLGPRPASTMVVDMSSNPQPWNWSGGSTPTPCWQLGSPVSEGESSTMTSGSQVRRQANWTVDGRPASSFDIPFNIINTTDRVSYPMFNTTNCSHSLKVTSTTTGELDVVRSTSTVARDHELAQSTPVKLSDGAYSRASVMPTVSELSVSGCGSVYQLGQSTSTVLDLDPSGRWSSIDCDGTRSSTLLDGRELFTDEDNICDDAEDGLDKLSIYALLCHVLKANPQLKVLLWGNQQWLPAVPDALGTTELQERVTERDANCSRASTDTTFSRVDWSRSAYSTLPRNYELLPH